MIGILLVTHGEIGVSILSAAQNIVGTLDNTRAIAIRPGEGANSLREQLIESINDLDEGDGVIILVDILGGTPANVALTLIEEYRIEILAGVNLPMLVSLLSYRTESDMRNMAQEIKGKGQQGIVDIKEKWRSYHGSCTD